MTNNLITLTIPNDDSVALFHLGKSLIGMSSTIDGCPDWVILSSEQYDALTRHEEPVDNKPGGLIRVEPDDIAQQAGIDPAVVDAYVQGCHDTEARLVEVDTTAQQAVPGATRIITEQVKVGDPIPVEGGLSQGYTIKTEEIANPVDKTGTPWDERIHSTSKALNADGSWRLRRKPKDMDEAEWAALVESVKAELTYREQLKVETEESFSVEPTSEEIDAWEKSKQPDYLPEPPVTPPGDDFHTDTGVVTEQTVAAIPPIPVPPPVVVPPVTDWDFPKLMTFLTERHGKIDVATVNTLLAGDGLSSIQELNAHPDKIGPFVARVKAHLGE